MNVCCGRASRAPRTAKGSSGLLADIEGQLGEYMSRMTRAGPGRPARPCGRGVRWLYQRMAADWWRWRTAAMNERAASFTRATMVGAHGARATGPGVDIGSPCPPPLTAPGSLLLWVVTQVNSCDAAACVLRLAHYSLSLALPPSLPPSSLPPSPLSICMRMQTHSHAHTHMLPNPHNKKKHTHTSELLRRRRKREHLRL